MPSTMLRRLGVVTAAATAAIAVTASGASAHHCYVPMYSLTGPTSANWIVISAEDGAGFGGFEAECDAAVQAGYDALRAGRLPVAIKIFEKMTIGDPKGEGRIPSPNGADGVGLEYFGAGSTLADEMVETWMGAAAAYQC